MKEILRRLGKAPRTTIELLLISLIANLLALASPVFVMLVLGRYITHGVDSTLITLSGGMVLAVIMEFIFRVLRLRLARSMNMQADVNLSIGAMGLLTRVGPAELTKQGNPNPYQTQRQLDLVANAYSASNLCSVLDVPFALLFIIALYLLNVTLGVVATIFIVIVFGLRILARLYQDKQQEKQEQINTQSTQLFTNAVRSPDTVRLFDPAGWLLTKWCDTTMQQVMARSGQTQSQGLVETAVASLQILLGACIIAIGATYVVAGELNVSALIGANILAARAFAPVSRYSQLSGMFSRAEAALAELRNLGRLDARDGTNEPARPCRGALEVRDLSFTHPGMPLPLYDKLSFQIPSGGVLLIKGANGVGKTSLMRLLLGLLVPDRGQVFADGIDIRQLTAAWWRAQIGYMPQEPWFFDASIRTNLHIGSMELDDAALSSLLQQAGLQRFIEENVQGVEMAITNGGADLALGIRKRLALARLIARDAPIVLLDEPTEGLDSEGHKVIYAALDRFSRERRTTIIISNDAQIARRASFVLDLDQRPLPSFHEVGIIQPLAQVTS